MKVVQSSINDAPLGADPCSQCQRHPSQHEIFNVRTATTFRVCCRCYVRAGFAPADWHHLCMETSAQLHPDPPPERPEPPPLSFNDLRAKLHALVGQTVDLEAVHMEADTILLAMLACLVERPMADQIARDFSAIDKWYS